MPTCNPVESILVQARGKILTEETIYSRLQARYSVRYNFIDERINLFGNGYRDTRLGNNLQHITTNSFDEY